MDPFSTSAIFAGINTAFRFAEAAVRIAEVGSENEVFVRTINVVRNNLEETQRLLLAPSVQKKLLKTPAKLEWIKKSIESTQRALYEVGKWVERARADQAATGTVKFETRVRWVFNNHEKLVNRQTELSACHQQLAGILTTLAPLEDPDDTDDLPSSDQVTKFEDMISPRQRRRQTYQQAQATQAPRIENANPGGTRPGADEFQQRSQSFPTTTTSMVSSPTPSTVLLPSPESVVTPVSFDATNIPVPSSPPPSYVAAIQQPAYPISAVPTDSRVPYEIPRKPVTSPSTQRLDQKPSEKSKAEVYPGYQYSLDEKTSEKGKMEVYPRYADPQMDTYSSSDFMCATNCSGPVDPFSMFHELADTTVKKKAPPIQESNVNEPMGASELSDTTVSSQNFPVIADSNASSNFIEAPGSSYFAVELPPNNDPGPPPGYPRFRSSTQAPSSRRFTSSSMYPNPQAVASNLNEIVHEAPTTYLPLELSSASEPQGSSLQQSPYSNTNPARMSDPFPEVYSTAPAQSHQSWSPTPAAAAAAPLSSTSSHQSWAGSASTVSSFQTSDTSIPTHTSYQSSTSSVPTISSFGQSSTNSIPTVSSFSSSTNSVPTMSSYGNPSPTSIPPTSPPQPFPQPHEMSRVISPLQPPPQNFASFGSPAQHPAQDISRVVSPLQNTATASITQTQPVPMNAKSKRMRNQRAYMDMLANLELK